MAKTKGTKAGTPSNAQKETKAQKFQKIGAQRMGKILKGIKLLGNLAGNNYEYTQPQVDKMFAAIGAQAEESFKKFQPRVPGEKKADSGFTF